MNQVRKSSIKIYDIEKMYIKTLNQKQFPIFLFQKGKGKKKY